MSRPRDILISCVWRRRSLCASARPILALMRARPLLVLTLIAASMVAWFTVRMWAGHLPEVWRVSCLLGAWAPLGAAAVFLYVRAVGDREDSVFAAWLVRAIGMHFTLAWLGGASSRARPTWSRRSCAPFRCRTAARATSA